MKVSFDFDDTLDLPEIQEYAKELIEKGVDVHIVTMRENNNLLHSCNWNHDLYLISDNLGIKRENIHFTMGTWKVNFFVNNPEFIWHLDNDLGEIIQMNRNDECKTVPISVLDSSYKKMCNNLLNFE